MSEKYPNCYQRARKATFLTQEEAAERLGLSVESLKQYEGGRRVPPDEVVARMCEVYGLPWLAYDHRQATDGLDILPEPEERSLEGASISLSMEVRRMAGMLDEIFAIAEDGVIDEGERLRQERIAAEVRDFQTRLLEYSRACEMAKKERPEAATSKRSRLQRKAENHCRNSIAQPRANVKPHAREVRV